MTKLEFEFIVYCCFFFIVAPLTFPFLALNLRHQIPGCPGQAPQSARWCHRQHKPTVTVIWQTQFTIFRCIHWGSHACSQWNLIGNSSLKRVGHVPCWFLHPAGHDRLYWTLGHSSRSRSLGRSILLPAWAALEPTRLITFGGYHAFLNLLKSVLWLDQITGINQSSTIKDSMAGGQPAEINRMDSCLLLSFK